MGPILLNPPANRWARWATAWLWAGVRPDDTALHIRKVMQTNVGALLMILTLATFTLAYAWIPMPFLFGITSKQWWVVLPLMAVWFLNAQRRPHAARLVLAVSGIVLVWLPIQAGQGALLNSHAYFALFAVVIPMVYDLKHWRIGLALILTNLALFALVELGGVPPAPEMKQISPEMLSLIGRAGMLACILTVVAYTAITEWASAENEARLTALATTDPLTGLPNRRLFSSLYAAEVHRAERRLATVTVAVLDLDHFKAVNDTFGHDGGDAALRFVCRVLQSQLRPYDTLARLGGEEFGLLMPHPDAEEGYETAERLRKAVERSVFRYRGQDWPLTVSIGVASVRGLSAMPEPLDDVLRRADAAMYRAKRDGRNRVRVAQMPAPIQDPQHFDPIDSSHTPLNG